MFTRQQTAEQAANQQFDDVIGICREISSTVISSEKSVPVARMIIQKLFTNPHIDLCSILPPLLPQHYADSPHSQINALINGKSLFFETVLEDDLLCNELWDAIIRQCETSMAPTEPAKDSILFSVISQYVTRMLPCDESPIAANSLPTARSPKTTHQTIRTPLQLFRSTSPLVNRISMEDRSQMMSTTNVSFQPRLVQHFCSFVAKSCTTDQLTNTTRLLLIRYLLKQFHVFCQFATGDVDVDNWKLDLMSSAPFLKSLFDFFWSSICQAPTTTVFRDITMCWLTYCRPWRYHNMSSPTDFAPASKYRAFFENNLEFYELILGKIIKKFAAFEMCEELIVILRAVVEFAWKEPQTLLLRHVHLDIQPHSQELLKQMQTVIRMRQAENRKEREENSGFWNSLFSTGVSARMAANSRLIGDLLLLIKDSDSYLGTRLMQELEVDSNGSALQNGNNGPNSTSQLLHETPKSGLGIPDHYVDSRSNHMLLTPNGQRQVLNREKRFDFSKCNKDDAKAPKKSYELGVAVRLATALAQKANEVPFVRNIGDNYSHNNLLGSLARHIMYPPVPNLDPNATVPAFQSKIHRSPPLLRLRYFASYQSIAFFVWLSLSLKFGFIFFVVTPKMGKVEEVEAEKKVWESDDAWELRKAFMLAHYDDYPKIQLQCLSQLFINVTLLGCEYSQSLMEKIRTMGAGISANTDRKKSGNYVKASAAKKRQMVKPSDLERAGDGEQPDQKRSKKSKSPEERHEAFNERLEKLKSALAMTAHHLTAEQMMKTAANSCLLKWFIKKSNQKIEIFIDRFVAFRHTFSQYCVDANECAVNALIESILTCEMGVNEDGDEVRFDGIPADECYGASVKRRFAKMKPAVNGASHTVKGLSKALESVNMSLIQNTQKLEGWSQQLDLVAGDLLLGTRILSATECTKPAMAAIADKMAAHVCRLIQNDEIDVKNSPKSHSSLAFI
ncbi:unnamed protein product [Caenorhabditis sp. 36 PRJEB53466]|nr:unnamed protein product [Caenorhabditis sp. 36 PRJEB53466]